jgi:hypothetical protein
MCGVEVERSLNFGRKVLSILEADKAHLLIEIWSQFESEKLMKLCHIIRV